MAKINLGTFGNQGIQAPAAQGQQETGLRALGQTMANVGAAFFNQAVEEKEAYEKSQYQRVMSEYGVALETQRNKVGEALGLGMLTPDQVQKEWTEGSRAWLDDRLSNESEAVKKMALENADAFRLKEDYNVSRVVKGYQQSKAKANLEATIANLGKVAMSDLPSAIAQNDAVIETNAALAGIDPDTAAKIARKNRSDFSYQNRVFYGQNEPSIKNLKAELKNLNNTEYMGDLEPEQRTRLIDYYQTRIRERDNELRAAERQAKEEANEEARFLIDRYQSGLPVSPELDARANQLESILGRGKGAGLVLSEARKRHAIAVEMTGSPLAVQEQKVAALKAKSMAATDPKEAASLSSQYEAAQRLYAQNSNLLKTNPYGYYENVTNQQIPDIDLGQPLGPQFVERAKAATAVKARTGVNPGLFKADELVLMKTYLDQLPVDKVDEFFTSLNKTGADVRNATIKSLGKVDPVLMAAGDASANYRVGRVDGVSRPIGPRMIHGQRLLESKQILATKKDHDDIRATMTNEYGKILDPAQFDTAVKMTTAMLASMGNDSMEKELPTKSAMVKQAAKLAIGGVAEYNGENTLAPYGMSPTIFEDKAKSAVYSRLVAAGIQDDKAALIRDGAILRPVDSGKYMLIYGRDAIADSQGRAIIVEIH